MDHPVWETVYLIRCKLTLVGESAEYYAPTGSSKIYCNKMFFHIKLWLTVKLATCFSGSQLEIRVILP